MKAEGINNSVKFILKESSPILEIRGGQVEESDKKLVKGTIVEGMLKERIPYRFIELKNKKGYLSPSTLNVYVSNFANLEGDELNNKEIDVNSSFGKRKPNKAKDVVINWGLPIIGGIVGYQIAKKMQVDEKKTLGFVVFFGLIGLIPRYLYNK
jgi:hypothetical protein